MIGKKLLFYFEKYFKKIFFFYFVYLILLAFLVTLFNGISTPINANLIFNNFWKTTKGYDFYFNFSNFSKDPTFQNKIKNNLVSNNDFKDFIKKYKTDFFYQWDKKLVPLTTNWTIINQNKESFKVNSKNFSFISFPITDKKDDWHFDYFYYEKNNIVPSPTSKDGPYNIYISPFFANNFHLKVGDIFSLNTNTSEDLIKFKIVSVDYSPRRVYNRENIFEGMNNNFVFFANNDLDKIKEKMFLNYYYSLYFKFKDNVNYYIKNQIYNDLGKLLKKNNINVPIVKKFDFNDMNTFYFKNYNFSVYYVVVLFVFMLGIFLFLIFFLCLEGYLSKLSTFLAVLKINGYYKREILKSIIAYFSFWFFLTFFTAYLISFFTTKLFLKIYLSPFILPYQGYQINNFVVLSGLIIVYSIYLIFIIFIGLKKLKKNNLVILNNLSELVILKTQKWKIIFSKFNFFIKSVINLFVSYFKNSLLFFSGIFITTFLILSSFVFNFSILSISDKYQEVNNFSDQYVTSLPFNYSLKNSIDQNNFSFNPEMFFGSADDFINDLSGRNSFSINYNSIKDIYSDLILKLKKTPDYKNLIGYIKKTKSNPNFLISFNLYYLDQKNSISTLSNWVTTSNFSDFKNDEEKINFQIQSIPEEITGDKNNITNFFPLINKNVIDELKNFKKNTNEEKVVPLIANSYFYKNLKSLYNREFKINGIDDVKFKVIDYLKNDFAFFPCVYSYLPNTKNITNFKSDGSFIFYKNETSYESFYFLPSAQKYESIIFSKTSNNLIKDFINKQFQIFIIIFWTLIILSCVISVLFTFIFMNHLLKKNQRFFVVLKAIGYKNTYLNLIFLAVYTLATIIGLIIAVVVNFYLLQALYGIAQNQVIFPIYFVFKIIWVVYTIAIVLLIIITSYIFAKKRLNLKNLPELLKVKD